jgi:uncharacterized protein (DUF2062 family)
MQSRFYHERIIKPIIDLLKQGITPEKIAMTLSCGIVMGLFPIVGITSVLCIITAFIFGLNQALIQLFNWLVYPLQVILIIPFLRLGNYLFHAEPITVTVRFMINSYKTDFWGTIYSLGEMTLHGIVAWLITAVPLAVIMYLTFKPLLRKMYMGIKKHTKQTGNVFISVNKK